MGKPTFTPAAFRRALGQFATGVTVVTVEREPGQVYGMTANSFTAVSLEPLLILVCVEQRALSDYFAQCEQSAEEERRLNVRYRWTPNGVPLLEGTLAQLACKVAAHYVCGDHTIFIGEVESAEVQAGQPLIFWGGDYRGICP